MTYSMYVLYTARHRGGSGEGQSGPGGHVEAAYTGLPQACRGNGSASGSVSLLYDIHTFSTVVTWVYIQIKLLLWHTILA